MKRIKDALKTITLYLFRLLFLPFKAFPIRKAVLFCANSGAGFICNPKAIYEELLRSKFFSDYKLIWCFKDPRKYIDLEKNNNSKICRYRSLKYYFYRITSKIVITNAIEGTECPKKRKQIRVQTWHGGGSYKKVALLEKKGSSFLKTRTKINIKNTDLFVSSSRFFTNEVIRVDFGYSGKVVESGMPRNDVLFDKANFRNIRQKVIDTLGIEKDSFIVLYAPTWRYVNDAVKPYDFHAVKDMIEKREKRKVVFLYRQHVYTERNINGVIDVTKYPDMQELMVASDMMISDYSSCIWDYSFLEKPCFLYCPDLKKYTSERGFVLDIDEWGFPVAETSANLEAAIDNFDLKNFRRAMDRHHVMLGSFETGIASKKVVRYLENLLKNE